MTSPTRLPERIDLAGADDPRDVVHRAVACLAQGGVVAVPTETTYGVVGSALAPTAMARVRSVGEALASPSACLLVRGADEVEDWVPGAGDLARKLARRCWPGAVTLRLEGRTEEGLGARLAPDAIALLGVHRGLALRTSSSPMLREVLRLLPCPLVLVTPGPRQVASSADRFSGDDRLDMVVDDGPPEWPGAATVVRVAGDSWSVAEPGVVDEDELVRLAATVILFVCTGNTCRSPMAEAICRALLARRLGCPPEELDRRGFVVLSAGVAAMHGMPAATHAVDVVAGWGGTLRDHASRPATPDLVRLADHVIAMTADHLDVLLDRIPEAAPKARLLDPGGSDLADPIGLDREAYLRTARIIEANVNHLLDEVLA